MLEILNVEVNNMSGQYDIERVVRAMLGAPRTISTQKIAPGSSNLQDIDNQMAQDLSSLQDSKTP